MIFSPTQIYRGLNTLQESFEVIDTMWEVQQWEKQIEALAACRREYIAWHECKELTADFRAWAEGLE